MNQMTQAVPRFFKVVVSGQSYLNLVYLLAAFPLGLFYFVFLVTGLSLGISTAIIWVGIPLLVIVGVGWWGLANFERTIAIHLLKEDIPSMNPPPPADQDTWSKFKGYLNNPVTWKSPTYLFLKFPLGLATFVILVTLVALTLALLSLPFTYELVDFQVTGFFSPGQPAWHVDSMGEAVLGMVIGLLLWPLTLQVINGLTWVHARFARIMLSADPWRNA